MRYLFKFSSPDDLAKWKVFSDAQFGGCSSSKLITSFEDPGTASFEGIYSRQMGESADVSMKRSGFAGMLSKNTSGECIDLDGYHSLLFRVKGDGRAYLANLRTENFLLGEDSDDVWQALLPTGSGEWKEVEIPLKKFVLTWRGKIVERKIEMNASRISGIGISLAGGENMQEEGPFKLGIDWIAARGNHLEN